MSIISKVIKVIVRLLVALLLIFFGLSLYNVFYPLALQHGLCLTLFHFKLTYILIILVIENKIMILQPGCSFFEAW